MESGIPVDRLHAVVAGRDARFNFPFPQRLAEPVGIVAAIRPPASSHPRAGRRRVRVRWCGRRSGRRSGSSAPDARPRRSRRGASSPAALRSADIASTHPLPELQTRCSAVGLGCVASIISVSFASPAALARASNIRPNTPFPLDRFQRLQRVLRGPYSGGAPHHRNPLRLTKIKPPGTFLSSTLGLPRASAGEVGSTSSAAPSARRVCFFWQRIDSAGECQRVAKPEADQAELMGPDPKHQGCAAHHRHADDPCAGDRKMCDEAAGRVNGVEGAGRGPCPNDRRRSPQE